MVDQKLVSFIKKIVKDGISLNTIKSQLKEKGWPESEINDAIQSAIPSETPVPKSYCWNCGAENDVTAKKCKNCSVDLKEIPKEHKGILTTEIKLSFVDESKLKSNFTSIVKGVGVPTDTFLTILREKMSARNILCRKSSQPVGASMLYNREGTVGTSVMVASSWNPFYFAHPCFGGSFEGYTKLTEMGKYNKFVGSMDYELKDYELQGYVEFKSSVGFYVGIIVLGFFVGLFLAGIILAFLIKPAPASLVEKVTTIGLLLVWATLTVLPSIFIYKKAKRLAEDDIKTFKTKMSEAFSDLEKQLQAHFESLVYK